MTGLIVDSIKKYAGRFLKDEETRWVEVDDEAARLKVSHLFRSRRRCKTKWSEVAIARQADNDSGAEEKPKDNTSSQSE